LRRLGLRLRRRIDGFGIGHDSPHPQFGWQSPSKTHPAGKMGRLLGQTASHSRNVNVNNPF
jgi:hypothetical protein